ncbi:MAG TPA: hypothetical protein VN844_23365 [Pyrinomonadaceae bacterium]|nr:hypothetical protein [Pyrinomonadaceae bacterium]
MKPLFALCFEECAARREVASFDAKYRAGRQISRRELRRLARFGRFTAARCLH